jgi:hypothetical protein
MGLLLAGSEPQPREHLVPKARVIRGLAITTVAGG